MVRLTVGLLYMNISEKKAGFLRRRHEETGCINNVLVTNVGDSAVFNDFVPVMLRYPLAYKLEDGVLTYEKKNGVLRYEQAIELTVGNDGDFECLKKDSGGSAETRQLKCVCVYIK